MPDKASEQASYKKKKLRIMEKFFLSLSLAELHVNAGCDFLFTIRMAFFCFTSCCWYIVWD